MKARIISLILCLGILGSMTGCASVYSKEYMQVEEVTGENYEENEGSYYEVSDYDDLKKAVVSMINSFETEKRFRFAGYKGDSEELQSDLSQAFWEARTETALGGYAVDYMSHDLGKILTYYEATVYIDYKRTAEEVRELRYVQDMTGMVKSISAAMENFSPEFTVKMSNEKLTEEKVSEAVRTAYEFNPLACVLTPEAKVNVYPQEGIQKIIEISFKYQKPERELKKIREELSDKIKDIVKDIDTKETRQAAMNIHNKLASMSKYVPYSASSKKKTEGNESTLYGALVDGSADSRGFALAYCALCHEAGIKCIAVSGTKDKEAHFWNMVQIDGDFYHVDVSASAGAGKPVAFMATDEQMHGHYWWNIESYPETPMT